MHRGKILGRHREKLTIYKPKREALEETNPADTLVWTSSLQSVRKEISVVAATRSVVLCYGTLANSYIFSKPSTSSETRHALPTNSWCTDHPHSRLLIPSAWWSHQGHAGIPVHSLLSVRPLATYSISLNLGFLIHKTGNNELKWTYAKLETMNANEHM